MKQFLFSLLLFPAIIVFAQKDAEVPYLSKALSASLKFVDISTTGGNITIISAKAGEEKVEVFIRSNNDKELSVDEIASRLQEYYNLDVNFKGDQLQAEAKAKKNFRDWKRALNISFRVYTPKEVSTKLVTSGGNIGLRGISGKQDFTTSGGNLNIEDLKGDVEGSTSGGNIQVEGSRATLRLNTSGGNIDAANSSGKMKLSTSGGNVQLERLSGDIDATTSGGNVKARSIEGDLSASTSGGNISLTNLRCNVRASTTGGDVEAEIIDPRQSANLSTTSGSIRIKLPKDKGLNLDLSADRVHGNNLENFTGRTEDDSIKGSINGGGAMVRARATSGNIKLNFQ